MDKPQAFLGDAIERRGLDDRITVGTRVCVGLIVGNTEEYVRALGFGGYVEEDEQRNEDVRKASHELFD